MRKIQDYFFRSRKAVTLTATLIIAAVVIIGLMQLQHHITQTVLKNLTIINNSVQHALHRKIDSEVISATQIIENNKIHTALINALNTTKTSAKQRFMLRVLLAEHIFPLHYSGFYLIGKNQHIITSMKEADSNSKLPTRVSMAIKRLEEGEPSVITHAFEFNHRIQMWLIKPVLNNHGLVNGYFALQLGKEHRFSTITLTSGISYQSGETYLIDNQGRLLSESRFTDTLITTKLLNKGQSSTYHFKAHDPGAAIQDHPQSYFSIANEPLIFSARQVIASHQSGWNSDGYRDYRGIPSIGVWQWDNYLDAAIITEMDRSEAMRDYRYMSYLLLGILAITLIIMIAFTMERRTFDLRLEREGNKHKNLLLESTAEAIFGVDLDNHCTFINEAFYNMLGYDEDDVLGKNIHQLIHHTLPDGKPYPAHECYLAKVQLQRKRIYKKFELFWHKDGHKVWVKFWAQPLFDNDKLIGSVVSFIEIEADIKPTSMPLGISNQTTQTPPQPAQASTELQTLALVVDDEDMLCELACCMLNESGIKTISASDGEEALALYQQHQQSISFVMTDLTMPKMDGHALLQHIREISPHCPFILCSGHPNNQSLSSITNNENIMHLPKPYAKKNLIETVQHILGGRYESL